MARHKRTALQLTGITGGLVMALLLSACGPSEDDAKSGDTKDAFLQATTALQESPVLGYSTKTAGATMKMRATRSGSATGTLAFGSMRTDVLTVGEKTYVRWKKGLPGGSAQPGQQDLLKNRWVTGGVAPGMGKTLTPKALGSAIAQQLEKSSTRFPDRASTTQVGGKDTWKASTQAVDVYVTATAPHQVVRITPKGGKSIPGMPTMPSELPSLPTKLPKLPTDLPTERASRSQARTALKAAPAAVGQMDLEQLDQSDVDAMFNDIIENTKQLAKHSADMSYQLQSNGQASFTGCGPAACSVTMTVSSRFVGVKVKPVSNIDAIMSVSMTAGGAPVGGCTTTGTLPVNGTGSLTCINSSPAWSAWYARARKQPGTHIYTALAQVVGRTMTEALQEFIIKKAQEEHKKALEEVEPEPAPTSPTPSPSESSNCTPAYSNGPLRNGSGTSGHATLCKDRPAGQAPQVNLPPGIRSADFDRGHLIADSLGGSGQAANITPLYISMNRGAMSQCEIKVGELVEDQEPVDYTVTANYGSKKVADSITLRAVGAKGKVIAATIPNTPTKGVPYC